MSSQTLERIIEEAKALTAGERRQLIAHLEKDARTAELRRIQSKYAGMKTSSDAFAARKAQDTYSHDH